VCSTGQGGDAQERLAQWLAWVEQEPAARETGAASDGVLHRNFTKPEYLAALKAVKEYIAAGDIYQANLTQRFETNLQVSPWELYLRLREANPAPFAAYVDLGGAQMASSSPERFLKLTGREVETRPIKGTRPRGRTPEEDAALGQELLASIKDNAELLMIVDLERNDLGRACKIGSIRVPELAVLESYETVHHLVATVLGELDPETSVVDLLEATFPGGSITGAPKIRSMEIIDELEPTRRSVYTGAIGYIGFDGNMDLNIAIRTIICNRGKAYFQVGGGIIADSDAEAEYQETLDKGRALARALDIAPETFI
jgi:para-aminobenzoate synthetase component 1